MFNSEVSVHSIEYVSLCAALGSEVKTDSTKEPTGLILVSFFEPFLCNKNMKPFNFLQDNMSLNLDDLIQSAANLRGLSDERLEKMIEQSDQLVLKLYDALESSKPQN